jgi:hypothetical protein
MYTKEDKKQEKNNELQNEKEKYFDSPARIWNLTLYEMD